MVKIQIGGKAQSKRVKKIPRRVYGEENLQAALDELRAEERAISESTDVATIAEKHDIPDSTLFRLNQEEKTEVPKLGRKTLLHHEEEEILARWVKDVCAKSQAWNSEQVANAARIIYQCRANTEDELPVFSAAWFKGFCKRWGLSERLKLHSLLLDLTALDSVEMMGYLVFIKSFIEAHGLGPEQLWTCDETSSIPKTLAQAKKVGAKGHDIFKIQSSIRVPKFSLLCCISAAGDQIPPFFLIPSSDSKKKKDGIPVIGPKGEMDDSHAQFTQRSYDHRKI